MKKIIPTYLTSVGYKSLVFFIPSGFMIPFFIYGLRNLNNMAGRLALVFSVLFVVGYSCYVPRTLTFKKHQLDYLVAWYKIASKKLPRDPEKLVSLRQSFIETAMREVILKEPDDNKRRALMSYLDVLISALDDENINDSRLTNGGMKHDLR